MMGDRNNNRTSTQVKKSKQTSGGDHFDIKALLSTHCLDTNDAPPAEKPNTESKSNPTQYLNFWPNEEPQNKYQHPKYPGSFIPPEASKNTRPLRPNSRRPSGQNSVRANKSMTTTLRGMSPEKLTDEGIEWSRLIKTPTQGGSSSVSNTSDDDFIIRCLTAESTGSSGSSIRWAEDAVESEWTEKLRQQWEDIEEICSSFVQPPRPPGMSQTVYDECLEWRRAFPSQDSHRLLSSKSNRGSTMSASPTIVSPSDTTPRSTSPFDGNQDYVHSWLNQCQQTSPGYSSLPIQSAKTKDLIRVLSEKGQFEESLLEGPSLLRSLETRSPSPASLLEYRSRIKVQRPISSHVRGHTITPISTLGGGTGQDRRSVPKYSSYLSMIDEQQLPRSRSNYQNHYQKSPSDGNLTWSRHEHQVIQEEVQSQLEGLKTEEGMGGNSRGRSARPNKTNSFVDWLFYDENVKHS